MYSTDRGAIEERLYELRQTMGLQKLSICVAGACPNLNKQNRHAQYDASIWARD